MPELLAPAAAEDCPIWCHVDHAGGRPIHVACTGEVLWRNGSVAVELTQYRNDGLIVLSNFADDENPACANLDADEARQLRDALDRALTLVLDGTP